MKIEIDGKEVFSRIQVAEKMGCSVAWVKVLTQKHKLGRCIGKMLLLTEKEINFMACLPDRRRKEWRNKTG